ncbi:hypothetical protein [Candidatus Amoebophilus asiaticus]|nr:hypothetical protein [Candidatus Amoebophilus asiaticus]
MFINKYGCDPLARILACYREAIAVGLLRNGYQGKLWFTLLQVRKT